jgi:hypothetical protein
MMAKGAENLYGINVKIAVSADLTGRSLPSTLPLTDLQYSYSEGSDY